MFEHCNISMLNKQIKFNYLQCVSLLTHFPKVLPSDHVQTLGLKIHSSNKLDFFCWYLQNMFNSLKSLGKQIIKIMHMFVVFVEVCIVVLVIGCIVIVVVTDIPRGDCKDTHVTNRRKAIYRLIRRRDQLSKEHRNV